MKFITIPVNEPTQNYAPGDESRESLKKKLTELASHPIEIPCIIGGKEVRTGNIRKVVQPHAHGETLATYHWAGEKELLAAADAALKAKTAWENLDWKERCRIFLRAADLIATKYRDVLNAATMLGQSKNAYQAEIDAACELIDFLRFNAYYYQEILQTQPLSVGDIRNELEYRPLEGFTLAITPFNFTAIAANLPSSAALLGNTTVWKPSDTQVLSAYHTMKIFEEAGVPPGVINFVPADGPLTGEMLLGHRDLAAVHFTGSTQTFRGIFKSISENIAHYRSYPRLVGETGGKDFVFAHPSANLDVLRVALVRGAFEYQGQKCSAASRAYIPASLWSKLKPALLEETRSIKMGDVRDFRNFVNAVIDERSFQKISGYQKYIRESNDAEILVGGNSNSKTGYFIEPTIAQTKDPLFKTMQEEIFGPVLTVFVYDDAKIDDAIRLCESTSPYALTGAIIGEDLSAVEALKLKFRHSAGNLYINDKPTGAVVGQQPFGGARASGTNDKAGSHLNLLRFLSPRTIKTNLNPPKDYRYPFMQGD